MTLMRLKTSSLRAASSLRCIHTGSSLPTNCFYTPAETKHDSKRLALLIGWIGSQRKHVEKYGQLYRDAGLDTLVVLPSAKHVIMPTTGKAHMASVLDLLMADKDSTPMIVHGFSVGGYMYGHLLNLLEERAGESNSESSEISDFHKRCKGQIFDSIVDFEGIPVGLSTAMLGPNHIMRPGLQWGLEAYLSVLYNQVHPFIMVVILSVLTLTGCCNHQVTVQYIASSEAFHDNHVPAKALLFYSDVDPISCPRAIRSVAEKWKAKGTKVKEMNFGTFYELKWITALMIPFSQAIHHMLGTIAITPKNIRSLSVNLFHTVSVGSWCETVGRSVICGCQHDF